MQARIGAGAVAGLIAGVVFGILMHLTIVPTPAGGQMPMIALVGQIVGSPTVFAGWFYHLFNSVIIGSLFGWLLGGRVYEYGSGLGWGAAYGFAWWIVGGLVLMPLFLGMPILAPLTMPEMHVAAAGSLAGHLIYGLILGGLYVTFLLEVPVAAP